MHQDSQLRVPTTEGLTLWVKGTTMCLLTQTNKETTMPNPHLNLSQIQTQEQEQEMAAEDINMSVMEQVLLVVLKNELRLLQ